MMTCSRAFALTLAFVFSFSAVNRGHAIAPRYISDGELASYPIIVIAKWDRVPAKSHHQYRGDGKPGRVVIKSEVHTELNVLQVLKGDVQPGRHELMLGWGITWNEDGSYLNSGTSTELMGDVTNVTKPALWFLKRSRSWDPERNAAYLSATNYREVQPLALKSFYLAMGGDDASTQVPKRLRTSEPIAAERILRVIGGGVWPWPYDGEFDWYGKPERPSPPLPDQSDRVWQFIQSDAKPELRRLAIAVYAELTGESGITNLRSLLSDEDAVVRGIVVGLLARRRDQDSLDLFPLATRDLEEAWVSCKVIESLASWRDQRVVPTLINFLENGNFAYRIGDDLGIPALKTRAALRQITGHVFPFEVRSSQEAWKRAQSIPEQPARRVFLKETIPASEAPLIAHAVGLPTKEMDDRFKETAGPLRPHESAITIRVTNVSPRSQSLLAYPSEVEVSWPAGLSARGGSNGDFVTLDAGDSTSFQVTVDEGLLRAERSKRRIRLTYGDNGQDKGIRAWIGTVDVTFGNHWKGKRQFKSVKETWPNGNLKAVGMLVNGRKHDEWHYFNEQGDRIRIEYPGTGCGTAICNPEHPKNKGAGIP